LAHHWAETEDTVRALEYLEKAGEASLATFANREAVRFFSRAIELHVSDSANDATLVRAVRWRRHLGEAFWKIGDFAASERELKKSLDLLGFSLPKSIPGRIAFLLKPFLIQLIPLTLPIRFVARQHRRQVRLIEAAAAAGQYAWIEIVQHNSL